MNPSEQPGPGDRYFGGASNNMQYSAVPGGGRGKTGSGDTVGPNDPIFHKSISSENNPDIGLTKLPKDAKPPGAKFDPVTPLGNQPGGPNNDELPPPGMH